ncbi:unnamed protein product [Didymodactylos carnosus]|uniref:RRM domain-containing protein n=1 Tax=Didymodactylos carnosus TaxID=1234261 RepID=A0A8S2J7T1_9BILA|nr:unnamed protein product [Didymodactylos carnosus]CAF3797881.1 unnamed protein product [Didymodactylos carnosus]
MALQRFCLRESSQRARGELPAIDRLLAHIREQDQNKSAIERLLDVAFARMGKTPPKALPTSSSYPTLAAELESSDIGKSHDETLFGMMDNGYTSTPLLRPNTNGTSISRHSSLLNNQLDYFLDKKLSIHPYAGTHQNLTHLYDNDSRKILESFKRLNIENDYRLKRAAAQERRQATQHFGKVKPGLCWNSPLPVRSRGFSVQTPSMSCKVFLGGIPHDIHERDLSSRLAEFGPCRLEWPTDNFSINRNGNHGKSGYVYVIFDHEQSVHQLLRVCSQKNERNLNDGRCEYYLDVPSHRTSARRKSIQIIPWFTEDSQWMNEKLESSPSYEQKLVEFQTNTNLTVFVGALHGMMTAFALAKICQSLFGNVEFAAIDTDRNKYPIGSGRVIFQNVHSYFAAVTANYIMIDCDRFSKVIQIDPYLTDSHICAGVNGKPCMNIGSYFCRSLKCWSYYCAYCWNIKHAHISKKIKLNQYDMYENPDEIYEEEWSEDGSEPLSMQHKVLMRNARAP